MPFTRRQFLASGSALAAAPFFHVPNRHRTLKTALIGSGWWGKNILKEAVAAGNCKVVALCDPDANAIEVAAEQVKAWNGDAPKGYADYREMLDREKPEVVIIATPDHWHALTTIAAVKSTTGRRWRGLRLSVARGVYRLQPVVMFNRTKRPVND